MNKNRVILMLGVISLLMVSMAVSTVRTKSSSSNVEDASDFYQRHPSWSWMVNRQNASIPITGEAAFPDYHQRHPELTKSVIAGVGASDYFQRHPELTARAGKFVDLSDYYFRQQTLASSEVDLTDYYFRHNS